MPDFTEEYVREFSGKIIGIVRTYNNGDKAAMDYPGRRVLGYYRAIHKHTTDFYGRVVSKNDTVVSLIYEDLEKKKRK